MSTITTGLRERRKQETRAHLSAVATVAFLERGFDRVTIAEVAELAGVSKMTVTNYFPLKEDLVFDRSPEIVAGPAATVRHRDPGDSPAAALQQAYLAALDRGDPTLGHTGVQFARMVAGSPALLARAREMGEERRIALTQALEDEPAFEGDPVGAAMAALVLTGVYEVLAADAQRRLLAGEPEADILLVLRTGAARLFPVAEATITTL